MSKIRLSATGAVVMILAMVLGAMGWESYHAAQTPDDYPVQSAAPLKAVVVSDGDNIIIRNNDNFTWKGAWIAMNIGDDRGTAFTLHLGDVPPNQEVSIPLQQVANEDGERIGPLHIGNARMAAQSRNGTIAYRWLDLNDVHYLPLAEGAHAANE